MERPALHPLPPARQQPAAAGGAAAAPQPGQKKETLKARRPSDDASGGGDAVAGLTRCTAAARERILSRIRSHHHARPSWSWVCRATLRVLQEYSMGTTAGILDSELQMQWSKASGGARGRHRGELAALALDHRFDPLTRTLELEVVEAQPVVRGQVDLLTVRHIATGERAQCILPLKLEALRAGACPVIGAGRILRLSGCRMVRLPKPKPPDQRNGGAHPAAASLLHFCMSLLNAACSSGADAPAYSADGDGVLTLLPTPYTTVVLDTGSGAAADPGDISTDDMKMMTFESGLSALLNAGGGDVSLNVRVASIEATLQEAGPQNTNLGRQPNCWRIVNLADDESTDTCQLVLHNEQVFIADQLVAGDYLGLQNPRVVRDNGIHIEMDDSRTVVFVKTASKPAAQTDGAQAAQAAAGAGGFAADAGALVRVLTVCEKPRAPASRRGSIGFETVGGDSSADGSPPLSLGGSQSQDDTAVRWELTMRCEDMGARADGAAAAAAGQTGMVVVEYTARRDGLKDLAAELQAGQVLWLDGLKSISRPARDSSGAAAVLPWFSLRLPVDTARAMNSGATSSSGEAGADGANAATGKLVMVSCAVGLLAAPWIQQPQSLQCCVQRRTELAHCRATLTNIEVLDSSDAFAHTQGHTGAGAPPLATQFSRAGSQDASVAAAATRLGTALRLTLDDGGSSMCVAVHPSAVDALWHAPLYELAQLSPTNRNQRLGAALGVTFEVLLALMPPTIKSSSQQKQQQQQAEYRIDGCAQCSAAGLSARLKAQLKLLA